MSTRQPALPGDNAWARSSEVPVFTPERRGPLAHHYRRFPAAIRLLGAHEIWACPLLNEHDVFFATRFLVSSGRRTVVHKVGSDDTWPTSAVDLRHFLRRVGKPLVAWWISPYGWRSPREFMGYHMLENEIGAPHIEPYEVAHLRLPDDVSMDLDVVLYQAWCQGVVVRQIRGPNKELYQDGHHDAIRRGMVKLHRSPWFMFALAAPAMSPNGILLGDAGLFDSALRMEWLLKHPYEATDAELAAILNSPGFASGYDRARKRRSRGYAINPDGWWYANGSLRDALGIQLRRGGRWMGGKMK